MIDEQVVGGGGDGWDGCGVWSGWVGRWLGKGVGMLSRCGITLILLCSMESFDLSSMSSCVARLEISKPHCEKPQTEVFSFLNERRHS